MEFFLSFQHKHGVIGLDPALPEQLSKCLNKNHRYIYFYIAMTFYCYIRDWFIFFLQAKVYKVNCLAFLFLHNVLQLKNTVGSSIHEDMALKKAWQWGCQKHSIIA